MFGMSSKEFWEDDPQLYWSYRTFYLKQREVAEKDLKYETWLKGSINMMATSNAINNNFSKEKVEYPNYEELFENSNITEKEEKLSKKDIDKRVQDEFNAWARY